MASSITSTQNVIEVQKKIVKNSIVITWNIMKQKTESTILQSTSHRITRPREAVVLF